MNNNTFYNGKPIFPGNPIYSEIPNQEYNNQIPFEQSYIENILRVNKGKKVKIHITVPGSNTCQDQEFTGIIEQSGRDHIIISEPMTGKWQLLLMIYVDYITFDESINYITY